MLWGISYILLFVSFILCYRGILQVEIKNGPWPIGVVIGTCILGEILTYSLPSYISPLTMYICDLIGIMILTKASKLYTLLLYPIAFFIQFFHVSSGVSPSVFGRSGNLCAASRICNSQILQTP